jgi:hypothetical protein
MGDIEHKNDGDGKNRMFHGRDLTVFRHFFNGE